MRSPYAPIACRCLVMTRNGGRISATSRTCLWTERNCGNSARHFWLCYAPNGGKRVVGHLRCEIVEGHRYADEPDPQWYGGQNQYARTADSEPSGRYPADPYDSGIQERPSGAFRLPEQRPGAGTYVTPEPGSSTGGHARPTQSRTAYDSVRIPVRGPEYPTIRPTGPESRPGVPTSGVPTAGAGAATYGGQLTQTMSDERGRPTENVYQGRRPAASFVVAAVMMGLLLPILRLLFAATFTGPPTAKTIVPAVLLALGFLLTGMGLFALASGRPLGRESWLRPPVAYLPVGVILLLAAGLAAGG